MSFLERGPTAILFIAKCGDDLSGSYFETSEADDVLGSLCHLRHCLSLTKEDSHAWKWVTLSLFSAVQGAMVCHAAGSTQTEVLTEQSAKRTLEWLDAPETCRGPFPEEKLAGPETLFNRLNGSYTKQAPAGGTICTTDEQKKCFQSIKTLRDDFNHFTPRGWAIEIALIRESIPPLLDLIETILTKGYAFRHGKPDEIRRQISEIRSELSK